MTRKREKCNHCGKPYHTHVRVLCTVCGLKHYSCDVAATPIQQPEPSQSFKKLIRELSHA